MQNRQFLALISTAALLAPAVAPAARKPAVAAEEKAAQKAFEKKLSQDDQIRHALSRLAFGPRPGDLDRFQKLGLKKWIDQQLHPERIPENPRLLAKLQPLDSLTLPQQELVRRYPPPALVLAFARGQTPAPADPV
jgi:hypothetical protein